MTSEITILEMASKSANARDDVDDDDDASQAKNNYSDIKQGLSGSLVIIFFSNSLTFVEAVLLCQGHHDFMKASIFFTLVDHCLSSSL